MARGKLNLGVGAAAIALAASLAISPNSLAESLIDQPGPAGNTMQANALDGVFQPDFALWPLTGPNSSDIRIDSNEVYSSGTNAAPGPFGTVAGNIVQVSSGANVTNPQIAIFTSNNSTIQTYGNWACGPAASPTGACGAGSGQSVTGGQVVGHFVDAQGNVFQMEFLEGNVINPQFAFMGDNTSDIRTRGNYAEGNGGTADGALAFVDAQGNVVQVMILSHNVINPQVSVGGSNNLDVYTSGNTAVGNGGQVTATGFAGIFSVVKVGNVTQIAILSNNVWAPQLVLPGLDGFGGTNTGQIITDTNDADSSGSTVDLPGGTGGGPIDVGNIHQWAPLGNGNIFNSQYNFANHHPTPDVVLTDENVPEETPPPADDPPPNPGPNEGGGGAVVESFMAVPTTFAGDNNNGGGGGSSVKSNWKPGDGLKKVVAGVKKVANDIHNALHPKPKPASDPAS